MHSPDTQRAVPTPTEKRLRESEERYRAFIANSSEGIWRYELDVPLDLAQPETAQIEHLYRHARLAELNDAMARMYGYEHSDELLGVPVEAMLPLEDPASHAYLAQLVGARFHVRAVESMERDREGRTRYFENSMIPIIENGKLMRAWGMQRDITDRKRAERALAESRGRYGSLVDDLRDHIILGLDANGLIREWTTGAQRTTGYAADEVIGKHLAALFTPEDAASGEAHRELEEAAQEGRSERELWLVRKGGERIWVSEITSAIRDASGTLTGFTKIGRDLTERKRTRDALRESEQRRLVAMEAAGIGDWRMDIATGLLHCSARTRQMHGLEGEGTMTLPTHDQLMHPADRAVVHAARDSALDPSGDGLYRVEFRFVFADGQTRWFESTGRAFFDERDGTRKATHILGAMLDITERKHAEQTLREADRRKDEFLATLAHELRNPLAPLKNGVQIARLTSKVDSPLRRTIEMMDRQLNHLVHLVNDLLDVARISSGKVMLRRERVLMSEVLGHGLEASRALIEARNHRVIVDRGTKDPCVEGDFDRLAQVFANLLSNAAKYMESGGEIRVSLARENGEVVVRVADTGIGIPAEDLSHVFDLFSQVRAHQGRAEGGLGIGLSLVKSLVGLHGGSISAESAGPGRGSCFTVRLPACEDEPACDIKSASGSEHASTRPRRILIADDNQDAATSLATLLEIAGHEVAIAHDGLDAVEKAQAFEPDIALLDLGMPRLGGIEAARRLRTLPGGRALHIVALTGWGQEVDRRRTSAAGFDAHFVKPVDHETLRKLIEDARGA